MDPKIQYMIREWKKIKEDQARIIRLDKAVMMRKKNLESMVREYNCQPNKVDEFFTYHEGLLKSYFIIDFYNTILNFSINFSMFRETGNSNTKHLQLK